MKKKISPLEAARQLAEALVPTHAQKVITPDCPKCRAPLWAVACESCSAIHHYCETCKVEYVFSEAFLEWVVFNEAGTVVEIIPPRTVGTLPGRQGGEFVTLGNSKVFVRAAKKEAAANRKVARAAAGL